MGGGSTVFGLLQGADASRAVRARALHSKEEEHLYVLPGQAMPHLGDAAFALRAGSYVCFPAGQQAAHSIHNTGSETFAYLMIGERIEDDEVTYPPEPA